MGRSHPRVGLCLTVIAAAAGLTAVSGPSQAAGASTKCGTAFVTNELSHSVATIDVATRTKDRGDEVVGAASGFGSVRCPGASGMTRPPQSIACFWGQAAPGGRRRTTASSCRRP